MAPDRVALCDCRCLTLARFRFATCASDPVGGGQARALHRRNRRSHRAKESRQSRQITAATPSVQAFTATSSRAVIASTGAAAETIAAAIAGPIARATALASGEAARGLADRRRERSRR